MADDRERRTGANLHRTERVLVFMIGAIVLLSIAAFVARMLGQLNGVEDWTAGAWPAVSVLPLLGLPLAMLLVVGYVVASALRRARDNRDEHDDPATAPGSGR